MRELLFRGKRTDNGEWVYGDYLSEDHRILSPGKSWILPKKAHKEIKVLTDTVGQYTGLTGKNGKKIFEGDIVLFRKNKCTVAWNDVHVRYDLWRDGNCFVGFNEPSTSYMKVIGNIHDNPELVEGAHHD